MPAPVASSGSESPGGPCTHWNSAALSRRTLNPAVRPGALLNSLDFGPRLDDGEEFRGILFRADFYVAEPID